MATILTAVQGAQALVVGKGEPSIDNWTFQLFYKHTSCLLLISAFLVTANQFFGDPIQCDLPAGGVSASTLKSYCWMYSSFDIPSEFEGSCARHSPDKEFRGYVFNSFYQWVSLCLVSQALIFYFPRALWVSLEGGLMKHLAKDAGGKVVEDAEKKKDELLATFNKHLHNKYDRYFQTFIGCELLNLVILVSQVLATNAFLGGTFLTYGMDVHMYFRTPPEENHRLGRHNPMCEAFPRVASCSYFQYGGGGEQARLDALCILALNIINDKVYLVLWWWYLFLLFVGLIRILERLLLLHSSWVRFQLMNLRMYRYFNDSQDIDALKSFFNNSSHGDWFILHQMSNNMNKQLFNLFLTSLAKKPKLTDSEIRQAHLLKNLGVTGKKKGEMSKAKSLGKPSIFATPAPSAPPSLDTIQEDQSRRRRRSSIEDILPGALLAFGVHSPKFGRRGNRAKSSERPSSPLPAMHPMQNMLDPKGLSNKFKALSKKK